MFSNYRYQRRPYHKVGGPTGPSGVQGPTGCAAPQGPTGQTGPQGESGAIIKILSMINTTPESIIPQTNVAVSWQTVDSSNSSTNQSNFVSIQGSRFYNVSETLLVLSITAYIGWQVAFTSGSTRVAFIAKNGNWSGSLGRFSYTNVPASDNTTTLVLSTTLVLCPGEYFESCVWHNDAATQSINSQSSFPASRITIALLGTTTTDET